MKRITAKYVWPGIALALILWGILDPTWFMPGPVAKKHAPIERQCERCHAGFAGVSNQSCLGCKKEMKYVDDRGIHLFAPEKRCAACHVDHRTREYPLASAAIIPDRFDHHWTGFDLERYHQGLACSECHEPGKPQREVKAGCADCHRDFAPGLWNHIQTGCDLGPLHGGLACNACHGRGWGEGLTPSCRSCHEKDDYSPDEICRPDARQAGHNEK